MLDVTSFCIEIILIKKLSILQHSLYCHQSQFQGFSCFVFGGIQDVPPVVSMASRKNFAP